MSICDSPNVPKALVRSWWIDKLKGQQYTCFMMEKTTQDEENRKIAITNWQMHQQIKTDSVKQMDNIILLVSTGSFGASILFLSYLKTGVVDWQLITFSWLFLLVALVYLFSAHEANAEVALRGQILINKIIKNNFASINTEDAKIDEYLDSSKDPKTKELNDKIIHRRNLAKWLLVAGMVSLVLFAALNFNHGQAIQQSRYNYFPH